MEQRNKLDKSVKQNIDYELIEKAKRKYDDTVNRYLLKQGVPILRAVRRIFERGNCE